MPARKSASPPPKPTSPSLSACICWGLYIAQEENKLGPGVVAAYVEQLQSLPEQVAEILADTSAVQTVAEQLAHSSSFFFLGRGFDYAVAQEGALKLKEVSYIHAEAYPAGS